MHTRAAAILVSLFIAVALVACGSSGASPSATAAGALTVADAWARANPAGGISAAYLTITNGTSADDVLVGVSAPDTTGDASLHETTTDSSGMMGMQPVDGVTIPAGQAVELKPGGYHIMLMDLTKDLKAGETVDLVLTFEQAGPVSVTADVRDN